MNDDMNSVGDANDEMAAQYPHDFGGAAQGNTPSNYGQTDARKMMPNDYPTSPSGMMGDSSGYQMEEASSGRRMMPNDYPRRIGGIEPRRTPIPGPIKWLGGCLAAVLLLGLLMACIFGSVAHAFFAAPEVNSNSVQDFTVTGVPLIQVHSDSSNVTAEPGNDNTVHVRVEKHAQAFPGNRGQSILDAINVTMTQTGNTINIQVQASNDGRFWAVSRLWTDIIITTPAMSNLEFTSSAGNIQVDGITGHMNMTSDAGNMNIDDSTVNSNSLFHSDAGNLHLDTVTANANTTLHTNAGNVDFSGTLGAKVALDVQTDAGNVDLKLPSSTNATFKATTDAGDITIDSAWPIPVNQQDAHAMADGTMGANPNDTIIILTHAGDVTVEQS